MDLAAAARRTLDEPSARVSCRSYWDPPRLPEVLQRGVTDLQRRRTHVRVNEDGPWGAESLYCGTASFDWWEDHWVLDFEGDVGAPERAPNDPLWIVERLARSQARGPVFTLRDELPHVTGEAALDAAGRIARVIWAGTRPLRPRSPRPWIFKAHLWRELELSDYGLPVDIPLPKAMRRSDTSRIAQIGIGLPTAILTLYGRRAAKE